MEEGSKITEEAKPLKKTNPPRYFFMKWWFWGIIVVAVMIYAASHHINTPEFNRARQNAATQSGYMSTQPLDTNSIKEGMYEVGADLPAGEYVLVTDSEGYFQITSSSSGSMDSMIANDLFAGRSIVTIEDGQYLELQRCAAYPIADAPKVQFTNYILTDGMYKVGSDLPAGIYKSELSGDGYIEISSDSSHTTGTILTNDIFSGNKYITISDGQYVKLFNAKIYLKQN